MNLLVRNVAQNTQAAGIPCLHFIHQAGKLEGSHEGVGELCKLGRGRPFIWLVVGQGELRFLIVLTSLSTVQACGLFLETE